MEWLRLALAVTVATLDVFGSQSQTLDMILLDLRHAPFSHGQAYVAISRVHLATDCGIYVNNGYRC